LDGNPREYGCPIGTVFKIGTEGGGQCTEPEGVQGCEDYYGDELKGLKKSDLLLGGDYNSGNQNSKAPTLRKRVKVQPSATTTSTTPAPVQYNSRVGVNTRDRSSSNNRVVLQQSQGPVVASNNAQQVQQRQQSITTSQRYGYMDTQS